MNSVLIAFLSYGIFALTDANEGEKFPQFVISPDGVYTDLDGRILFSPYNESRRVKREDWKKYTPDTKCNLPEKLIDFLITCQSYPDLIVCLQHCPYGYTFPEGIAREMKCWHELGEWEPYPKFQRCKPFVDCLLTLRPGGKYLCYTQFLDEGNKCEVSCQRYEDLPAVPPKNHVCDIKGNWTPKLPHCVKAGSGLELVPPPKGQKTFKRGK